MSSLDLVQAECFVASLRWRQVRMDRGPIHAHEYVINGWEGVPEERYWGFGRLVRDHGYEGIYRAPYRPDYEMRNHYLEIGDYVYWTENLDFSGTSSDSGKLFRAPKEGGARQLMHSKTQTTLRQLREARMVRGERHQRHADVMGDGGDRLDVQDITLGVGDGLAEEQFTHRYPI